MFKRKNMTERMEEKIMDAKEIIQAATDSSFAIWFLIGAGLVFFMQAGFAMVEQDLPEQRTLVTSL